jgi:GT2 family glycosyltransferase
MKIAVVILNWNGKELLKQFLPKILRYSSIEYTDIYVADNASTDDSINYIKQHFSTVKIIRNRENGGYAKGYNEALQQVDAEIFAFVNSDIEVTDNWLEPIYKHFKENPNIHIAQPKILDYKQKEYFEYAGAGGGFVDQLGYPYCRGRIFDTLEKDDGQYNDTQPIFWASGACLFIRSSVFHELEGFDTDYFAHQEEIDLCWRAYNKGYKTVYIGASTVYHIGGATLNKSHWKKTFFNFRNSLYNLLKNAHGNYHWLIFQRLVLDGIAGIKFLLNGQFIHTIAIIKAHFSFYAHFFKMLNKRRDLGEKRKDYYRVKNIVWNYYFKKKKKYSEL